MRKSSLVLTLVATLALSGATALARSLYVSPTGSDSAAGDATHPWATLQYAANSVAPGDTVNVLAGNYTGAIISNSGTAAQPITFLAQSGVYITTPEKWGDGIDCEGSSYITINGFTANSMGRCGFRAVSDNGVIIENCKADSAGSWGILTGYANYLLLQGNVCSNTRGQHGIYVGNSCAYDNIIDNVCYGNAGCGIHVNGDITTGNGLINHAIIEGNVCYNNGSPGGGAGINMSGVINSTIANNLLYNNYAGGFTLYGDGSGSGPNNDIVENNTVVMASTGRWAMNFTEAAGPVYVRNNIVYHPSPNSSHGAIEIDAATQSWLTSDYNMFVNDFSTNAGGSTMTLAAWQAATGQDAHSTTVSSSTIAALFVNMAANNYHLAATSAAIDAGTSALAPTTDLDGNPRPSGSAFDIGAYEFQFPSLLAGDANGDGKVSFADYLVLEQNFGKSGATWAMGDFNNDGKVSFSDYLLLEQNFGKSAPEPASLALLAVAGLGLLRRSRK